MKNLQEIIFNIMKENAHHWLRYWKTEKISGIDLPGEYIEIRSNFISDSTLSELIEAGFKVKLITTQQINADAYCDVLLKRKLNYHE